MPTHISAVEVMVSDLKKAVKWYQEVLGFNVVQRSIPYKTAQLSLSTDPVVLDIGQPNSEWGPQGYRLGQSMIGRVTGITLQTDNIERLWKHIQRKKGVITEPPRKRPWGEIRMRLSDLDGNEITIVEVLKKTKKAK
ncbi:MAG: VOC family protein [Nanoarchaeota archaeon]